MSESPDVVHHAGNALGKKLGPLPVWGYAIVIAAVAWGFFYWRSHSVGAANTAAGSAVPPVDAGMIAGASGAQPVSGYSGIVSGSQGTPSLSTNAQWSKYAADQLNALGYSPDAVANALSDYANGKSLSTQSKSLIDIALQKFGTPPQGVLPVVSGPAYTGFAKDLSNNALFGIDSTGHQVLLSYPEYQSAGGNAGNTQDYQSLTGFTWDKNGGALVAGQNKWGKSSVPTPKQYTVTAGDTAASIAQKYTGDPAKAAALLAANGGSIPVGQRITIPF